MSGELDVKCGSKVTHTSVIPSDARKLVQWPAVKKTCGAISVPEQSTSFCPGWRNSAISAPTSGCWLPSSCPLTIAPAGPQYRSAAANSGNSVRIVLPIVPPLSRGPLSGSRASLAELTPSTDLGCSQSTSNHKDSVCAFAPALAATIVGKRFGKRETQGSAERRYPGMSAVLPA